MRKLTSEKKGKNHFREGNTSNKKKGLFGIRRSVFRENPAQAVEKLLQGVFS